MKYALVNEVSTHARDVESGTLGMDLWFTDYEVKAHVGRYRQFWTYVNDRPVLPHGYEPESEWHNSWKTAIIDEHCEVICGENNEHRADIMTDECVIEIQKSPIDGNVVLERIDFYKNLTNNRVIWVVNIENAWKNKRIETDKKNKDDYKFIIKWSYAHKWVKEIAEVTDAHLYLDFNPKNDKLIHAWIHKGVLYGRWVKKTKFFEKFLSNSLEPEYTEDLEKILDIFNSINS